MVAAPIRYENRIRGDSLSNTVRSVEESSKPVSVTDGLSWIMLRMVISERFDGLLGLSLMFALRPEGLKLESPGRSPGIAIRETISPERAAHSARVGFALSGLAVFRN
jgi:hypothetical protein